MIDGFTAETVHKIREHQYSLCIIHHMLPHLTLPRGVGAGKIPEIEFVGRIFRKED
jgi:hypothetical protein